MMEFYLFLGWLAWWLLFGILLMRPLADLTKSKFLRCLLPYRKQLGIVCGLAAILHAVLYFVDVGVFWTMVTSAAFWRLDSYWVWGVIGLLLLMPPFLTSSRRAIEILGGIKWKRIQQLAYVAFIFTALHLYFVSHDVVTSLLPLAIWAILWMWARAMKPHPHLKIGTDGSEDED